MKYLLCLLLSACSIPTKTENFCLPKRGMRRLLIALSLGFVAISANAEPPAGLEEREIQTRCDEKFCVVLRQDMEWMAASNADLAKRLKEAEKKNPKCAKVEVTEPSKAK